MAKNKIGLQFTGWKELLSGIDKVAGEAGLKKATEDALKASKEYVNKNVNSVMRKGSMPARGRYWTGDTKMSLDKDFNVQWTGFVGEMKIGFNLKESGLTSIFLMKGTPKMPPVSGLNDAFYGRKTKNEIKKIQQEAVQKFIERNL